VKPQARKGEVVGEVLHVDDFGNVVSNISAEDLERTGFREGDSLLVRLGGKTLTLQFCSAYGEVPAGVALAIIGSSDFLEVAVNQGSASRTFKAKVGGSFHISVVASN